MGIINTDRLKSIWSDVRNYSGQPGPVQGGTPYLPIAPAITKFKDVTPGFSLGINDWITGYKPPTPTKQYDEPIGPVQQPPSPYDIMSKVLGVDTGMPVYGGGGSGSGGGTSYGGYDTLAAQVKAQQQQLADQEKGNINARRDALVGDIGAGYTDQMAYLDSQTQGANTTAQMSREKIAGQRDATVQKVAQDAEVAARVARDTYRDLILQGRRRARATGGGSSSGYLEITSMLDNQLMRGLGQVEQTKQGQIGAANGIADQSVGQIEASLQQILGEIANNRAISLREKESKINEAKLNAADALLEVDKWLAQTFSDIETAKLSMRSSGGGSSASYNKANYGSGINSAVSDVMKRSFEAQQQLINSNQWTPENARALVQLGQSELARFGVPNNTQTNYAKTFGWQPYKPGQEWANEDDYWEDERRKAELASEYR